MSLYKKNKTKKFKRNKRNKIYTNYKGGAIPSDDTFTKIPQQSINALEEQLNDLIDNEVSKLPENAINELEYEGRLINEDQITEDEITGGASAASSASSGPAMKRQLSNPRGQKDSVTVKFATAGAKDHLKLIDSVEEDKQEFIWTSLRSMGADDFTAEPLCYTQGKVIREQPWDNTMFATPQPQQQLRITNTLGPRASAICWNLTLLTQNDVQGNEIPVVRQIMRTRMGPIDRGLAIIRAVLPNTGNGKAPVSLHMIAGRMGGGIPIGDMPATADRPAYEGTCQQCLGSGFMNGAFGMVEAPIRGLVDLFADKGGATLQDSLNGVRLNIDGEDVECHIGLSFCTIRSTESFNAVRNLFLPDAEPYQDPDPGLPLFDIPGRLSPVMRFKIQLGIITHRGFIPKTPTELFGMFPKFEALIKRTEKRKALFSLQSGDVSPLHSGHLLVFEVGVTSNTVKSASKGKGSMVPNSKPKTGPVGAKFGYVK
jgi:hypothetical protein